MKSLIKISNKFIFMTAFVALISSNIIVTSGSFFLFGEPKCPKSLIK